MTANRELAELRGVSEYNIQEIDRIHTLIDKFMNVWVYEPFSESRKDEIHDMEYLLQRCWGFPEDCGYHRYANEYEFKCGWVGRTFQCEETGEKVTIPFGVKECNYFKVGNGAVDVGRLNAYCRIIGNVSEIKEDI